MAIRVGRWDCPFCGHRGNLGPDQQCNSCGKPRGKNVKFYLTEDAQVVTSAAEIAQARAGPDWVCDHCGGSNPFKDQRCKTCANEKNQADIHLETRSFPGGASLNQVSSQGKTTQTRGNSTGKATRVFRGIGWGFFLFFVLLGWVSTWPKNVDLTVVGHEWKRTIAIENYRLVRHQDWTVPPGGEIINRFRAIHHYDQVFDHYETRTRTVQVRVGEEEYVSGQRDLGNGYFEDEYSTRPIYEDQEEEYQEKVYRDVAVYQTKYVYRIYEWVIDRTAVAEGKDKNPLWPQGAPVGTKWRNGETVEVFTLLLKDKDGNEYNINSNHDYWDRMNPGDQIKAKKKWGTIELPGSLEKK